MTRLQREQQELLHQWAELRGKIKSTHNRRLVLRLRRVEEEIKTEIRAVEQQIRAAMRCAA